MPFSRGSSFLSRDQTWVSYIADSFFLCLSHQGSSRYLMIVSREDTKISLNILSLKDTSFLKVADAIVVGETLKIIRLSSSTFQKGLFALCVCVCVCL